MRAVNSFSAANKTDRIILRVVKDPDAVMVVSSQEEVDRIVSYRPELSGRVYTHDQQIERSSEEDEAPVYVDDADKFLVRCFGNVVTLAYTTDGDGRSDRLFDHEGAAQMYADGMSLREVGMHYNVSAEAIRRVCKTQGVPRRSQNFQYKGRIRTRKVKGPSNEVIAQEYASGLGYTEITKKHRVGSKRVRKALVEQGVRARREKKRIPDSELKSRYEKGESANSLATQFKVTTPSVLRRLRRVGVDIRPRGRPQRG